MDPGLPSASETQLPEDPTATPEKTTTSGTPTRPSAGTPEVNSGGFVDLIGTPDLVSPMSWSAMSLPSTDTLRKWQSAMPEGLSQETPPVFQIPSKSPSPDRQRRSTSSQGRRAIDMEISPTISFRDPRRIDVRTAGLLQPPAAEEPEPSSSRRDREPEST